MHNRLPFEIDVVADSRDGQTLLVAEAKITLTAHEIQRELEILRRKAEQLPFIDRYKHVVYKLFVAKNPPPGTLSLAWVED